MPSKTQKEEKWDDKKATQIMAESIEPHSNKLPAKKYKWKYLSKCSIFGKKELKEKNDEKSCFICSAPRFGDLTFYFTAVAVAVCTARKW